MGEQADTTSQSGEDRTAAGSGGADPGRAPVGRAGAGRGDGITGRNRPRRPAGVDDATVEASGTVSEALEYVERARGHLYSFHQLIGRADSLFGDGADQLEAAGHARQAEAVRRQIVGLDVLDGRWTFQVVEEFDEAYYACAVACERLVREELLAGHRHVHESDMKKARQQINADGPGDGPEPR